jgi:hypothetical protein
MGTVWLVAAIALFARGRPVAPNDLVDMIARTDHGYEYPALLLQHGVSAWHTWPKRANLQYHPLTQCIKDAE